MAKTEPIRNKNEIRQIAIHLEQNFKFKYYVLFVMGVYTALRISDLLSLKWNDIFNFETKVFNTSLYITEKKTQKSRKIALNPNAIEALQKYLKTLPYITPDSYLFPNNRKNPTPISRIQAYRVIKKAVRELNIEGSISCHSMRKVVGYHAVKEEIARTPIISCLYNHGSEKVTFRYVGIIQDEIDNVLLSMNFKL